MAVIYAYENYSTVMLEKFVHHEGETPPNQHAIENSIPPGLAWYTEARSAILIVPSVVARIERNLLFNAAHPNFPRISAGHEETIRWDQRPFES